ncbi:MAG TPA: NIPSNAP family protein [Bryobacteraceae bacterium]|nr:NIPSNAP family protein [Bryobacteraceae bacterium]
MSIHARIVALTISVFFAAAAYAQPQAPEAAPSPSLKSTGRILELRTYYANPGKLEDIHKRFRDHTMRIFAKHGMTVVGFWGPVYKKDGSDSRLTYMLSFKNREERDAKWREFASDPEWQKVAKESEANGKLLEKIDSVFLYDTDYAPAK